MPVPKDIEIPATPLSGSRTVPDPFDVALVLAREPHYIARVERTSVVGAAAMLFAAQQICLLLLLGEQSAHQ